MNLVDDFIQNARKSSTVKLTKLHVNLFKEYLTTKYENRQMRPVKPTDQTS